MGKKSFVFYGNWLEGIERMPDGLQAQAYRMIARYGLYGEEPAEETEWSLRAMFYGSIKTAIDNNARKYERLSEAGKRGMATRWRNTPRKDDGERAGDENGITSDNLSITSDNQGITSDNLSITSDNLSITSDNLSITSDNLSITSDNLYVNDNVNYSISTSRNALSTAKAVDAVATEPISQNPQNPRKDGAERQPPDTDVGKGGKTGAAAARAVVEYYNARIAASRARLRASLTHISDRRMRAITARLGERGMDEVRRAIDKAAASSFLNTGASNAPVDLDWIMNANNLPKILEGKYDDRDAPRGGEGDPDKYRGEESKWL